MSTMILSKIVDLEDGATRYLLEIVDSNGSPAASLEMKLEQFVDSLGLAARRAFSKPVSQGAAVPQPSPVASEPEARQAPAQRPPMRVPGMPHQAGENPPRISAVLGLGKNKSGGEGGSEEPHDGPANL